MGLYENTENGLKLLAGSTLYADAPIGAIQAFGGATAPSGWFICDGSAKSRIDFAELFAVIGTAFGTGDGSTTFNLPDLREAVPKGAGLTGLSNNHIDSNGVLIGEFIDDQLQDHVHSIGVRTSSGGTTGPGWHYLNTPVDSTYDSQGVTSSYRKGNTTEVKSVGVNYIIKAKMVALPADLEAGLFNMLVPDYANPISGISGQSWTATEDCYVIYNRFAPDTKWRLYLDEHIVTSQDTAGSSYTFVFSGYVKKGSVLRTESGATLGNMKAYPLL